MSTHPPGPSKPQQELRRRPVSIIANASADGDRIRIGPTKNANALRLVIDTVPFRGSIIVTEPNVRELRDALNVWLGD